MTKTDYIVSLINKFGEEYLEQNGLDEYVDRAEVYPKYYKGYEAKSGRKRIKDSFLSYYLARSIFSYRVYYSSGANAYHSYINSNILAYIERKVAEELLKRV